MNTLNAEQTMLIIRALTYYLGDLLENADYATAGQVQLILHTLTHELELP